MITVDAARIRDDRCQVDKKRKQSSAMSDTARLAARQMIHAASSLPDDNVEGNFKMSFFLTR